jgi:hypothetical protein
MRMASNDARTPIGAASTAIDSRSMPKPPRSTKRAEWCNTNDAHQPSTMTAAAIRSNPIHCQSSISATDTSTRNSGSEVIHHTPIDLAIAGTPSTVVAATTQSPSAPRTRSIPSSSSPSMMVPSDTGAPSSFASSPGMALKSSQIRSSSSSFNALATFSGVASGSSMP